MSLISVAVSTLISLLQLLNPWNGGCNTTACRDAAIRIVLDNKPDVKPCDNFYQFVCGNFMAGRTIDGRLSRLGGMEYEIDEKIKSFLQEKPKRFEPRIFRSLKRFFHMCMDENTMDSRGAAPGLEILEKLGGWPVLGKWDPAKWSFIETAVRSWQLGLDGFNFMEIGISVDLSDHTKHVFKVEQPNMPIPKEYLIQGKDNSEVKEYFMYMVDMATFFGADRPKAEEAMAKVLQLQIELAKVVAPEEERRGFQQRLKQFTLKELDEDPNKLLDWRNLFEGLVSPNKLQDDQKIYFYDLEVIHTILSLINGYSAEIIANHVMWNFAIQMSPYLTKTMRDLHQTLEHDLRGRNGRSSRWQQCVEEVKGFRVALSAFYVKKVFDKSSRNKAKAITNLIQEEMDKVLLEADWMDEKTRQKAQQKSAKMLHVIGYPDELANMTKVEEYYKELKLNRTHFFEANMDLNIFLIKGEVRKINKVSVKRPWELYTMDTTNANTYYLPSLNSLVATAGILQEPFFSAAFPSYLNYASLGIAIGHEVTHAFDDQGREFNEEGELNEWWEGESLKKFNEKKQCLIKQYNSFTESITKQKVNGINTQGENIADNGGLKLAYRAYRRVAEQMKNPEPGLPFMNHYTNDQLFFIRFAHNWCGTMPFKTMMHDLLTDEHAPTEWRINGALMNMPEFGDKFGCSVGTPMNPEEKCEVW